MSFCTLGNKNTTSILETGHSASERSGTLTSQCLLCSFIHRYCRRDWYTAGPLQALRVERWIRHHLYPTVALVCSGGPSGLRVKTASQSCNLEWKKPNIIHSFLSLLSMWQRTLASFSMSVHSVPFDWEEWSLKIVQQPL